MDEIVPIKRVEQKILLIRNQKVILDSDLAELYGVETKYLVRAVKRNITRFPGDFMFQLNEEEFINLRFHFGTSSQWRFSDSGAVRWGHLTAPTIYFCRWEIS